MVKPEHFVEKKTLALRTTKPAMVMTSVYCSLLELLVLETAAIFFGPQKSSVKFSRRSCEVVLADELYPL